MAEMEQVSAMSGSLRSTIIKRITLLRKLLKKLSETPSLNQDLQIALQNRKDELEGILREHERSN